jgi:uncharacterized protein YndB with AHSA1/START domain
MAAESAGIGPGQLICRRRRGRIRGRANEEALMKWVLIVGGSLLGVVLLITLIGLLLPKSHTASVAKHYEAPPAAVWSLITQRDRFASWRSDLRSVEQLPATDGNVRWKEQTKYDAVTMEVTEAVPEQRLVTRIADEGLPFGGTWTFELGKDGAGTLLTITERGEVYNPIFRFVSRFVMGHTATMEKFHADAARALQKS